MICNSTRLLLILMRPINILALMDLLMILQDTETKVSELRFKLMSFISIYS